MSSTGNTKDSDILPDNNSTLPTPVNATLPRSEVRAILEELLIWKGDESEVVITSAIERLELVVDNKIKDLMSSFSLHRDKVTKQLYNSRKASELERKSYDVASRHREGEAIRIETSLMQEKYEKDLKSRGELLAHAQHMNKLLTKEIYFLMEKNTDLSDNVDREKVKILNLETSIESLSKANRRRSLARRKQVRTPGSAGNSSATFVTAPSEIGHSSSTARGVESGRSSIETADKSVASAEVMDAGIGLLFFDETGLAGPVTDREHKPRGGQLALNDTPQLSTVTGGDESPVSAEHKLLSPSPVINTALHPLDTRHDPPPPHPQQHASAPNSPLLTSGSNQPGSPLQPGSPKPVNSPGPPSLEEEDAPPMSKQLSFMAPSKDEILLKQSLQNISESLTHTALTPEESVVLAKFLAANKEVANVLRAAAADQQVARALQAAATHPDLADMWRWPDQDMGIALPPTSPGDGASSGLYNLSRGSVGSAGAPAGLSSVDQQRQQAVVEEEEGGRMFGPELPPHLLPEEAFIDLMLLSQAPMITNMEEHERLKQTILDSFAFRKEVEEKSIAELIKSYNQKDEDLVQTLVPHFHKRDSLHSPNKGGQQRLQTRSASMDVKENFSQTEALFTGFTSDGARLKGQMTARNKEVQTEDVQCNTEGTQTTVTGQASFHRRTSKAMSRMRTSITEESEIDAVSEGDEDRSTSDDSSSLMYHDQDDTLSDELSEQRLHNETLLSMHSNLEQEVRDLSAKYRHSEQLSERRHQRIEHLEEEKRKLEVSLETLRLELVSKDNQHTISIHERDMLLRELSHQLYDAREATSVAKVKLKALKQRKEIEAKPERAKSPLLAARKGGIGGVAPPIIEPSLPNAVASSLPYIPGLGFIQEPPEKSSSQSIGGRRKDEKLLASSSVATGLKQLVAEAKGAPPTSSKKGSKYYNHGPELLTSLKGTKLAVMRMDDEGGKSRYAPMALSDADISKLNILRKEIVEKIVDKTSALKAS